MQSFSAANGRWISEDPLGFTAGDANVGRYVGNKALQFADPSGLGRIHIEIIYYFKKARLTPTVIAEVDRIMKDAMTRFGGKGHSVYIHWIDAGSQEQLDRRDKDRGFWGPGKWKDRPLGVIVMLDDKFPVPLPGENKGVRSH